jgi:hypothetical protein
MKQLLEQQASVYKPENSVINPVTKEISQAKVTPNLNRGNDKLAKSIVDKTGDGLNSNVIKLSDHIVKLNKTIQTSIKANARMSEKQVGDVTSNAMGKRQFNTLRPRVEGFKENVKDFFSMRGFLDKTGIAKRGSGGLVSEYLDRGEAKKKYVDQRMKTKGTTFGSKETFEKQFDEQKRIESDINKNEKQIKDLRSSGATDIGLKRGGFLKKREELATQYAKVAPDARPTESKSEDTETGKVIPFKKAAAEATSSEETMLEQNKMVSEQTVLLTQIEENTRGLAGVGKPKAAAAAPASAGGGMGLMDMLGMGGIGGKVLGGVKTAGSFLGKGALGAAKFIGRNPLLMAGTAVAAGAYTGYKGYQDAGDKQNNENVQTEFDLTAGKITQEEADARKLQTGETATVGKSKSVGKGSGMAIGGAAGALKGAAVGAALGSVVPVVGTAIGGLLGGAIGGIGGSYLGGAAGDYVGEKTGELINYAPKAYKSVKEGASNLYGGVSNTASKFYDGASRMAGDAGEGLLRAKNKVSDTVFNAKASASDYIDRNTGGSLTKVGNVFDRAENSVRGMLGMGDKVVDNGDGSKTTFKSDGTKIEQGGFGTKTYDKSGKLISEKSPSFVAGASTEKFADGSKIESADTGALSIKKETAAGGGTQTTSSYDLGVKKFTKRETLTARQVYERNIDARMAAGLPDKIPVDATPAATGAAAPTAAPTESKEPKNISKSSKTQKVLIGGEEFVEGSPLSDKQMHAISMKKMMDKGNKYPYPAGVDAQYAKQQPEFEAANKKMEAEALASGKKGFDETAGMKPASGVDGNVLSKKSTENEQAKMDASKASGGSNTSVVAPTINNSTNQTQLIKSPTRNQESSQAKYLDSRYAF